MEKVKRVACINDLSGYGRCSLTTVMPVISVLGAQCCPVPTAVLSAHTGFGDFFFKDMTHYLKEYLQDWIDKKIEFDAVYSGFLGSYKQIEIAYDFIIAQKKINKNIHSIVDTVMGDKGEIYSTYTKQMCYGIRKLVSVADVITPNVTEACDLTDTIYKGEDLPLAEAKEIIKKIGDLGCKSAVITGIHVKDKLVNLVCENDDICEIEINKTAEYSGTGDLFASCLTGFLLKGKTLAQATEITAKFIYDVLEFTLNQGKNKMEGIMFEPFLAKLGGY